MLTSNLKTKPAPLSMSLRCPPSQGRQRKEAKLFQEIIMFPAHYAPNAANE